PGTPETVRVHIERAVTMWAAGGPVFSFGIRLVADDSLVGTIDVQLRQPYLSERQANLAYGLYPVGRGKGLATRAVLLAVELLRRRGDVDEVVIRTEAGNPASAAVAKRAGFRFSHTADAEQGKFEWYVLGVARD
ncbi:MAG: GNAT family N-acetyltransferase, partial [Solirubrobacterales bacterium]|nr:GNAT family N-acetyltransferase [Solirubrobacterales bacterium]